MPDIPQWVRSGMQVQALPGQGLSEEVHRIRVVDGGRSPTHITIEPLSRLSDGRNPTHATAYTLNDFVHRFEPVELGDRMSADGSVLVAMERFTDGHIQLWRAPNRVHHRVYIHDRTQMDDKTTLYETYAMAEVFYLEAVRVRRQRFGGQTKTVVAVTAEKLSRFDREDPI